MSKIYEALRQHQPRPLPDEAPPTPHLPPPSPLGPSPSPLGAPSQLVPPPAPRPSPLFDDLLVANRDMQTLYRSVEALITGIQGGALLMFTSAHAGEGKTTVCGAFAATLAHNFGKSVLILDGDRNHALTQRFGSPDATMPSLAKSPEAVLQSARRIGARGSIVAVPVGSLVGLANADSPDLDLLASIKPRLAHTFDYMLIDAPSVADVSWSPSIGPMTDGVILVIEAERTRWPVAVNAKKDFENSGAKVLGAFLNKRQFYIPPRIYRYL